MSCDIHDIAETCYLQHVGIGEVDSTSGIRNNGVRNLARGIGHELNNLLQVIEGYTFILIEQIEPKSELQEFLQAIRIAIESMTGLIQRLATYSEPPILTLRSVDPVLFIRSVVRRLGAEWRQDIAVVQDEDPYVSFPPVLVDGGAFEECLRQLCDNSFRAMGGSGQVCVAIARWWEGESMVGPEFIEIAVSDTGKGIDPDDLSLVSEPSFTTKGSGRGLGLGLPIVESIVAGHGGVVEITSAPGRGTTVYLRLPME